MYLPINQFGHTEQQQKFVGEWRNVVQLGGFLTV